MYGTGTKHDVALYRAFSAGCRGGGLLPRRRTLSDSVDPSRYRARIIASFMVAIPLANFIGSPLSGLILSLDGWLGLRGWHLLFIIEGLPAVLLGIAARFVLRDRPHRANWLNAEQKKWLETTLETERQQQKISDTRRHGSCSGIVKSGCWR